MTRQRKPGGKRSPHWPAVRRAHLKRHPACAVCGDRHRVEAHHCVPFHVRPGLELDPANLITLCEAPGRDHHLWFGHLGDWKSFNPSVRRDAARWLKKIRGRPYATRAKGRKKEL